MWKSIFRFKEYLQSRPVLSAPDLNASFKLAVDASDVAVGAILLQEGKDGIDHPVLYFLTKFNQIIYWFWLFKILRCMYMYPLLENPSLSSVTIHVTPSLL